MAMNKQTTQRPAGKPTQQPARQATPHEKRSLEDKARGDNPIARMGTGVVAPEWIRQRTEKADSVSKRAEDNQVPFIYILQANSPQLMKGHEKYVPGAQASNIWLRNDPDPLIDGEEGMDFQCCHFSISWVEWLPERAGLAGRHDEKPSDAYEEDEEGEDGTTKKVWKRPNGNYLAETRYHVGFVHRPGKPPEPYTMPLTSTGHTVSKGWTTAQNRLEGGRAQWYEVIWTMQVSLKRKGPHAWYQYDYKFKRYCTREEAAEGKNLHEAFKLGTKRMADDEMSGGGGGDGGEVAGQSEVM